MFNTDSNQCEERTSSNNGLNNWCIDKYGSNYNYILDLNKCIGKINGSWTASDEYSDENKGKCTSNGLDQGNKVLCNGGMRIIAKYTYNSPQYGGIGMSEPSTTKYSNAKENNLVDNDGSIAYIFENCNTIDCDVKCESNYDYWNHYDGSTKTNYNSSLNEISYSNYCIVQEKIDREESISNIPELSNGAL